MHHKSARAAVCFAAFATFATVAGCAKPPGSNPAAAPRASSLMIDLQAAGLDSGALPDSPRLLESSLRDKVMLAFNDALGVGCNDCHKGTDYISATPNSQIALHMWRDFVGGLQLKGGGTLFCDSCHQGKAEFLDRTSDDALGAWMNANFVKKLERRDGGDHGCITCHGDPFERGIFEAWQQQDG